LLLDAQQFGYGGVGLSGAQQGEAVIDAVARRIGPHFQSVVQFCHGLHVGVGIFVKGFAEVSVFPKTIVRRGLITGLRIGSGRYYK
jgi:hypothetical protein